MNKHQTLVIYGILIILSGISLLVFAYNPSRAIQYLVGIGMCLSALFAIIASIQSSKLQLPSFYHALHALGMSIYGIAILFFASNLESFFSITIFFLLYYGTAEIIFCFQSLIFKDEFILRSFVVRLLFGLFVALGAVFIMATATFDHKYALWATGIVFVLGGIHILPVKIFRKNIEPLITKKQHLA